MHLITGYSGTAHITSANDGAVNAHVFGSGSYVFDSRNKFSAEIVSNNVININAGEGLFNGRYFEIVSGGHDVANIDNGASGTNRIDLIVARYTKNSETGVEAMAIAVIKGTAASSPVAPSYNTGNILDGVSIADFPLYKVTITGITVTACEQLFTVRKDIVTDVAENNASTLESIQADNELHYAGIIDGSIAVPNATNSTTATKLGASTVGGANKPIYLNGGVPTAISGNYYQLNTLYTNGSATPSTIGTSATCTSVSGYDFVEIIHYTGGNGYISSGLLPVISNVVETDLMLSGSTVENNKLAILKRHLKISGGTMTIGKTNLAAFVMTTTSITVEQFKELTGGLVPYKIIGYKKMA